ncbi:MAG TPA: YidC/Oxa1 family membrane protein insertase [Solirubrobacteraceae bacterium]|jgi:YidC/Oxa1 family membrane protein insertase
MTLPALIAPVQIIVDLLKPVLVFFHDTVGVGWGMSIVLLTVLVRAAMAPLTVKQFKSMRAMAQVAPRLKELQAKYKDDKQRQQQEVMKFYQEEKINPFASCLPLVAQIPFFIGLFYLLQSDLRTEICGAAATIGGKKPPPCGQINSTGAEQFLFIPDLTAPATGWVLVVLIVLYIGSQLLSSVLTPSGGDRNTKIIMYGLPFVFTPIIIGFPAGLIVYWVTTNLWTVGQGYLLRKKLGPIMPPAPAGKDGGAGEAGGFLSKLTGGAAAAREPAVAAAKSGASGKSGARAGAAKSGGGAAKSGTVKSEGAAAKSAGGAGKSGTGRTGTTAAKAGPSGGPPPRPPRKKKKRSGRRR